MNTFLQHLVNLIFPLLPATRCFGLKRFLLRMEGVRVGKNVRVCSSVKIYGNASLELGNNVWLGHNCVIICAAPVKIGNDVNVAPLCYIGTGTHEITPHEDSIAGKGVALPITIGNGSWICARSIIIAGCTIGDKTIVAAGAVVTKDQPSMSLVAGVPAKKVKSYN